MAAGVSANLAASMSASMSATTTGMATAAAATVAGLSARGVGQHTACAHDCQKMSRHGCLPFAWLPVDRNIDVLVQL
jgi:hypothetical protein